MKKINYIKKGIIAAAVSLTMGGLAQAADQAADKVGVTPTSAAPGFVSALSAGGLDGMALTEGDKALLSQITPAQLDEIQAGTTDIDGIAALGDRNADLTFTPINPCRVIDTGAAGGNFTANERRNYTLGGKSDFTSYGGSNGACTLPGSDGGLIISNETIRAWSLNIVAASPQSAGNLLIWPTNLTAPTASTINFQALTPNLNIANGVIVQNCTDTGSIFPIPGGNPLCGAGDLSIKANASTTGVRVVVDITGYYTMAGVDEGVEYTTTGGSSDSLTGTDATVNSISVTLANAGHCVVSASGYFANDGAGNAIGYCTITTGTTTDTAWRNFTLMAGGEFDSWGSTRGFSQAAGSTTYNLVCKEQSGTIRVQNTSMTASCSRFRR